MGAFLKYIFQLLLSPAHGWEDLADDEANPRELAARGFYPLTAIAAVSVFAKLMFHSMNTVTELLIQAIITYMMYFIGYFAATFVLGLFSGTELQSETYERRSQLFAMFSVAILELMTIIVNLVPITLVLAWFLPVYVAIVMWKGCDFMGVRPGSTGRFMLLAIPGVLLPPFLINLLFTLLTA